MKMKIIVIILFISTQSFAQKTGSIPPWEGFDNYADNQQKLKPIYSDPVKSTLLRSFGQMLKQGDDVCFTKSDQEMKAMVNDNLIPFYMKIIFPIALQFFKANTATNFSMEMPDSCNSKRAPVIYQNQNYINCLVKEKNLGVVIDSYLKNPNFRSELMTEYHITSSEAQSIIDGFYTMLLAAGYH